MKIRQTEYHDGKPATRKILVDGHEVNFLENEEPEVPYSVGKHLLQFDRYEKVEESSEEDNNKE